jgi:hypothetical protein
MSQMQEGHTGAEIVNTLESMYRKYVALDAGLHFVLALWTLATHVFDCFDAYPYLAITSPTKRCGKTRLAEIIELFCCNGQRIVGATPAAIFRTIQMYELDGGTVTLILDEAEVLGTKSDRSEALREILNAGYRRGQSVQRCERTSEGAWEVQRFSVYSPKVIVLIGNLNDTLADRCIPIAMRRRKPGENVERFLYSQALRQAKRYRKELENWAKTNRLKVKRCHRQDLEFLEDREAELWLPLFSVCRVVAPERLEQLKITALKISHGKQSEEPAEFGVLLLKDIREIFDRDRADRLSSTGLLGTLAGNEESPWSTWGNGRGLDARGLARLLRPFKIGSHNLRLDDGSILKGYARMDFEEVWATYLPGDSAATALQAT